MSSLHSGSYNDVLIGFYLAVNANKGRDLFKTFTHVLASFFNTS